MKPGGSSQAPLRSGLALLVLSPFLLAALIWLLILAVLIGAQQSAIWLITVLQKKRINTSSPNKHAAMPSAQSFQKPSGG